MRYYNNIEDLKKKNCIIIIIISHIGNTSNNWFVNTAKIVLICNTKKQILNTIILERYLTKYIMEFLCL